MPAFRLDPRAAAEARDDAGPSRRNDGFGSLGLNQITQSGGDALPSHPDVAMSIIGYQAVRASCWKS